MRFFLSSIDTTYSTSIARFINDSPNELSNCKMEKTVEDGKPYLILVAKVEIRENAELRYDYGDRKNLCGGDKMYELLFCFYFTILLLYLFPEKRSFTI